MTLLSVKTWTGVIWDVYYVVGACKWLSLVSGALGFFNHKGSFQFYYMFVITLKFLYILRGGHVHFWAVGIVVNSLYCKPGLQTPEIRVQHYRYTSVWPRGAPHFQIKMEDLWLLSGQQTVCPLSSKTVFLYTGYIKYNFKIKVVAKRFQI